ncbi:hypothetical protein NP233_g6034 [Leucocoprinus birnbaumii]|uniref:Mannosyltransferase n=1 Tax=Leucocoprinus birnbaumii TaxID=56174 RepID=A0AAD5VUG8_9AGAR|nr:hypothetical protein NP233_g6034 [Leucocoprinus birnbaumii]
MEPRIVQISLCVRIAIAILTRTVFQPDEYFQSLEPAFHLVFGYGHLTWEWLSENPIRSIIYPALNVPIYWLLKVTGLSFTGQLGDLLLILLPKALHGAFAAATDIWLCELARVTLGNDYVSTVHMLSLSSMFHALALSRSLSNSLETSLSTIAFAYYPWDASSKLSPQVLYNKYERNIPALLPTKQANRQRLRKTLIFSALACMIRPTNAVIWVLLYLNLILSLRRYRRIITSIISEAFLIALGAIGVLFILDSLYYKRPIFTPYNFLKTNLSSVSLFYGSNPWHYYLTQALPILCTTALPFTLHGMYTTVSNRQKGSGAGLSNMLLVTVCQQPQSVGFLMPCHSTPGQAYLHRPTWEVWSLGCEPPLRGQNLSEYRDQTDLFFDDPLSYINTVFPNTVNPEFPRSSYPASLPGTKPQINSGEVALYPWKHEWPRHLVFFGVLLKREGVREALEEKGYAQVWKGGREWEGEGERKGGVQIWSWQDQ